MRKLLLTTLLLLSGCATNTMTRESIETTNRSLTSAAETYVKLVLAMGEHDADYVDAYYGPPEWREQVKAAKPSLQQILGDAAKLRETLAAIPRSGDEMTDLRHDYLARQTAALSARAEILTGKKMTFDEESKALYDAVAPHHDDAYFQKLVDELAKEVPGDGDLATRLDAFRSQFIIPKDKLDLVFQTAIKAGRERTLKHIPLPPNETFTVEYVTNKSWSGYNWYQGNSRSLIQVNTDLPIYIDRAIDLACHEGYPGHHVYNALLEKNLVRDRGWVEFTVYPLFSPQSLIAEGSANYGIEIAFPGNERVEWEKKNLFPLAGLDPSKAEQYYRVQELSAKLAYAGNEAARHYLDGDWNADQAVNWLVKYALMAPERARQRLRFMEQYRAYVINYNLGKDLVAHHIESVAGSDPEKRWKAFEELLSSPRLPSALK